MSSSRARPNVSLYISNLSYSARTEDLRKIFARYGPLKDIYIPLDYYSRKPRGFAYVQFDDIRDAEDAVYNEHGATLYGKEMVVDFAQGDRKTPRDMRHRNPRRGDRSRSRTPDRHRRHRSSSDRYRRSSRRRSYSNGGSRSYSKSRSPPNIVANERHNSQNRDSREYSKSPLPPQSPQNGDDFQRNASPSW